MRIATCNIMLRNGYWSGQEYNKYVLYDRYIHIHYKYKLTKSDLPINNADNLVLPRSECATHV